MPWGRRRATDRGSRSFRQRSVEAVHFAGDPVGAVGDPGCERRDLTIEGVRAALGRPQPIADHATCLEVAPQPYLAGKPARPLLSIGIQDRVVVRRVNGAAELWEDVGETTG